LWDLPSLVLIG